MEILLLFACVLALVVIDVPIAVSLGVVAIVAIAPVGEADAERQCPAHGTQQGVGAQRFEDGQVAGIMTDQGHLDAAEGDGRGGNEKSPR